MGETDKLLVNLGKIERGLAKIYEHLSKNEKFSGPVRTFWRTIMKEELLHAQVFEEIRERAAKDDSFHFEAGISMHELEAFVEKINALLRSTMTEDITEAEAYRLGAKIETELDESSFLNKISAADEAIAKRLKQVENDTKKHRMIMINHMRGID